MTDTALLQELSTGLAPYTASKSSSGCFLQLPTLSSLSVAAGEEEAVSAGMYRVETVPSSSWCRERGGAVDGAEREGGENAHMHVNGI